MNTANTSAAGLKAGKTAAATRTHMLARAPIPNDTARQPEGFRRHAASLLAFNSSGLEAAPRLKAIAIMNAAYAKFQRPNSSTEEDLATMIVTRRFPPLFIA
jgi:hypothetical protein